MEKRDLRKLALLSEKCNTIIEVGMYKGRTTATFLDNTKGMVFSIDKFNQNFSRKTGTSAENQIRKNPGLFYAQLRQNFKKDIEKNKLIVLEMMSTEAATALKFVMRCRGGADLIFLDADHSEESVTQDIRSWKPLLHPKGILAGHDVQWETVTAALDKELPEWFIPKGTTNLWAWSQQEGARTFWEEAMMPK